MVTKISSDLKQQNLFLVQRVHHQPQMFSRAAVLHMLAGHAWLLQCNGTSLCKCICDCQSERAWGNTQLLSFSTQTSPLLMFHWQQQGAWPQIASFTETEQSVPSDKKNHMPVHRRNVYDAQLQTYYQHDSTNSFQCGKFN